MIDPSESEEEWVELYNAATTSIDLTGGVLCDSRVNNCEIAVSTSTISAGGYIILSWNSSKLNNDTDKVIWKNPAGEVVDQVQYGIGEIPVASDGYSLARNAENNWVVTTVPTLGAENIIQAPLLPASSGSGSGGVPNSGASIGVETKNKTTKTVTSTVKIKEDPVNVVWKVKVPTQGAPYEALLFDASDSADPRGGLLEILWNFGDGVSNFGDKVPHSYVTSGIYFVTVSATSSVGTIGEKKFTLHIASDLSTQNTEVKISEVLANPIGADKREFIRLYNASSSTVDLSGWRLSYKEKEYIFPVKTKMPSGSFLTFYQAVTHFTLENSGGQIELFTPNDELADVMNYDKAIEGVSSAASSTVLIADKKVTKIQPLTQSVKNTIGKKALRTVGKTLAEVRTVEKNTAVQVQGTVAVLPGVFGVQYFYITNDLGGIQIYQHKKLFPLMKIGDIVLVKGVTSASGDMQRVKVSQQSDITVLSSGTVSSTLLALEDLAEDQLGRLVRIAGEITEIKSNFMYVDDGTTETVVYFKKGAKIDKKQFKEGELVEVEGILEKSRTGLQIWPRGQGDIVITGQSEDLLSKESVGVANGVTDTASKYLTATAGGITTLLLGFFAKVRGAAVRNLAQKGLTLTLGLIKKNRA